MKRMTKAEMKRRHLGSLLWGVFLIAFGIFAFVEHFAFPHPSYEELQTKEVAVESVVFVNVRKGNSYYRITTSNGEQYVTCGFETRKMEEKLHPGDLVTIKYHDTSIAELKKGEEFLVTYADHYKRGIGPAIVFLVGAPPLGILFIKGHFSAVKNDVRKQENRDRRIKKKYGENSKIK